MIDVKAPARVIAAACLLLAPLPAAAQRMVEGPIAYESCGGGIEAVVLLHDSILDSSAFDEAWPMLCNAGRTIRYDRRGYGVAPASGPYDPVSDLDTLLRRAGVERAILVASSAGSGVAVDFALDHPQRMAGLVLLGPSVSGFRPTLHFQARNARIAGLLAQGRLEDAVRDPYILTPAADAARRRVLEIVRASPGNLAAGQLPRRSGDPAMARLAELTIPTLIVTGEADIADVHAHAGALEALIPGARRTVLPGAGHFLYVEQPKAFAALVIDFVGSLR